MLVEVLIVQDEFEEGDIEKKGMWRAYQAAQLSFETER